MRRFVIQPLFEWVEKCVDLLFFLPVDYAYAHHHRQEKYIHPAPAN